MKNSKAKLFLSLILSVSFTTSIMTGFSFKQTAAKAAEDPLGKYNPPINVTVAGYSDSTVKYPKGQTSTDNTWTRAYKSFLGMNVNFAWVVDSQQFEQKMNLTIASGDLPDIFPVSAKQLSQLEDEGSIENLTDVYNKYASKLTKEIYDQDSRVLELGKSGGKLYALPNAQGSSIDLAQMLYVREDWRKKLKLPEPKTMNDFFKIADAFTNKDPDGNGKKDTYALAITKSLAKDDSGTSIQGFAGVQGFANAYHAYLNTWIKDSSGKVVYGSVQPQAKTALQKLQEMYKKGQIDPQFAVYDMGKASEGVVSGKVGMEFGAMWNPFYPLQTSIQNNKNAVWKAYPIPVSDGKALKVSTTIPIQYYWVVRKGFKYPEAAVKMVNLFTEKFWGKTADNNMSNGDGVNFVPFKYALAQTWPPRKNLDGHFHVVDALKSGSTAKLNVEEKSYFDKMELYLKKGDVAAGWGTNAIFGQNSTYDVIAGYVKNKSYIYDEYHGVPTQTMMDKGSTLDTMENEAYIKIIMGAPISDFDKFVSSWKSLGGDNITKEMNAKKGK